MIRYVRLQEGQKFPDATELRPFKAIVIAESDVSPEWRSIASRWLVDSGCLYMMAHGASCSEWDTSVDIANLEAFDYGDIPEDEFIMTTWHNDEPLKEVFWFAQNTAHHPTVEISNVLLFHVGTKSREDEFTTLYESV